MQALIRVLIVICLTAMLATSTAWAQHALKLGAGIHFDEQTPGIGLAYDISASEGLVAFSPFVDFFSKSESRVFGGGLNLVVKRPTGENGIIYFGGGGGIGSVTSKREFDVDIGETTDRSLETVEASRTQAMVILLAGLEFATTERASVFLQGKWIGMYSGDPDVIRLSSGQEVAPELDIKSFAFQIGLSLNIGQSEYEDY
ncbi:MAG: hypothetical protein J4F39_14960 [Candidatus Latescibacteria bacterium]|nr:hypothetical protein [Candidatus Latescibacterota bacterium]